MVWVCGPLGRSAFCCVGLHRQAQHAREPKSRDPRLGFCRPHTVPGGSVWPFCSVAEPTRNARVDGYGPGCVRMGLERSGSDRRRGVGGLFTLLVLFMLTGLTLMGLATVRSGWSRGTGAVVLATGVFGWVYNLTDSGAVLEARS